MTRRDWQRLDDSLHTLRENAARLAVLTSTSTLELLETPLDWVTTTAEAAAALAKEQRAQSGGRRGPAESRHATPHQASMLQRIKAQER